MSVDDLLDDETWQPAAAARAAPRATPAVRLTVVSGPDAGRSLVLRGGAVVIGSGPGCDLVLSDRAVSRRHLELRFDEAGVHATDLGSRNGTFHGGARAQALLLAGAARLRLGPTTEIELLPEGSAESPPGGDARFGALVCRSRPMRQLFQLLGTAAASEASVLLLGETGTGKEALAAAIHGASPRRGGPFVVVDCGALPRELAGSELFGHARGAFTGAAESKRGLVEAAGRGTLFLDEIGELPLELQPQLLRVLENREIRPIGETRSRPVDIRVVAATHRDLPQLIRQGRFRQDLYFRLAVVQAVVPPLRERLEDVPLLVAHFLAALGQPTFHVSEALMMRLMTYDWRGNVRELRNVVQRCVSLRDEPEALSWPGPAAPPPPADALDEDTDRDRPRGGAGPGLPFKEAKAQLLSAFERDYLVQLLDRHGGNISRAAQEAGIDRNHIHRLVKRYGIPSR